MTWQHTVFPFLDYVFPLAEPLSAEDLLRSQQRLQMQKDALTAHASPPPETRRALPYLLDKEEQRRQGIDARLTSILGLTSIAGTVAFGGFFLGTTGTSRVQSRSLRWLAIAVGCYLVLQICAAILAAVRGLSRRAYSYFTLPDLIPRQGESSADFASRKALGTLDLLSDHETQDNEKLTQMACAHLAMRNFLFGLIAFTGIAVIAGATAGASDELVDRLKKDHNLYELLRGPQGPLGIPGAKGDPGAPCLAPCRCAPGPKRRKAQALPPAPKQAPCAN
jgi:hypothetical protein